MSHLTNGTGFVIDRLALLCGNQRSRMLQLAREVRGSRKLTSGNEKS
jgi:hypothetical protein